MTTRAGARRKRPALERVHRAASSLTTRTFFLPTVRTRDNSIVLLGRRSAGNHSEFARYLAQTHPDIRVYNLIDSESEYREATRAGESNLLRATRLRDLITVTRARAIISVGGPASLGRWVARATRPLFVDAWHGVGFKSRISTAGRPFLDYDAHFVSSPHVAAFYGSFGANALVTGYARTDALLRLRDDAAMRRRLVSIFEPEARSVVLFAPTWGVSAADGLGDRNALVALNSIAAELGIGVAYRPHRYGATAEHADLERVRLIDHDRFGATEELLGVTDILITDWSSIANDFHALGRPVIYLDAEEPSRAMGPLDATDRVGAIVNGPDELVLAVQEAVSQSETYLARYAPARLRTVERAWGTTLDGASSQRYLDAIERLEHDRGIS